MTQDRISSKATITLAKDQVSSTVQGEVVILNFASGVYYGLDEVGAHVWHLLSEPRTLSEIRDAIMEEYEVEPDRCERDLHTLLEKLATEGLIEVRDEALA